MFIRHAEKPDAHTQGVREDGTNDADCLTPRGWQRAGALAVLFAQSRTLSIPGTIYAAGPSAADPSQRALLTITPLAKKLGLEIVSKYEKDAFPNMLADAMATSGTVLVAWEHKALARGLSSGLVPGMAVDGEIPNFWPDDRFDVIWVFEHAPDDRYRFTQVPQLVLDSDGSQPIGQG
jgi:hypothetical protein